MIVDVSSPDGVDLLRLATLRFGRGAPPGAFVAAPATLAFATVADANRAVVGWCWGYHLVRPDASSMLYLHGLEVANEHRRQGHGRALLEAFMAAGKRAGATKMFLSTVRQRPTNRPRRLYDSMGGGLAAQGPTVNYWLRRAERHRSDPGASARNTHANPESRRPRASRRQPRLNGGDRACRHAKDPVSGTRADDVCARRATWRTAPQ